MHGWITHSTSPPPEKILKKNLLEAERNDNALLVKPADVRWNMGFRPDDENLRVNVWN